jgi:guanylate kinase
VEFEDMIRRKNFIEWAEVHGNMYGTSFGELERIEKSGKNPLLEIDVQGWHNIKPLLPNALSIFILPPSLASLWQRLESRGSDSLEIRWERLQNAYDEIKKANEYEVLLINKDLEQAFQKLKSLVMNGKSNLGNSAEGLELCQKLNEEFETADWIKGLRARLGESPSR